VYAKQFPKKIKERGVQTYLWTVKNAGLFKGSENIKKKNRKYL
jgi:hypothetical protein